jgi:DNA-binding CsgD family transcriptional regulator
LSSEEQLSELIGQIYDCAIDSALWRTTLPTIAAYLDCSATLINIVRPSIGNRSIYSLHDYGLSHDAGQLYLEKYAHIDPTVRAGALFDVDEVFTAREAVGDDIWTASPMYHEWNIPHGLTEHLSGIIRKDVVRIAALTALREQPFFDVDRDRMRLLLPHLRRSVSIAQMIGDATVDRDRFREIVDRLTVAVFLVDSKGVVRHANASGEKMLADGNVLRSRNGRLMALAPKDQAELVASIERGHLGQAAVPLTAADGNKLVATILPLNDGFRRPSCVPRVAAAVFVDNPAGKINFRGDIVAKLFNLTGAELQLLLALLDGATLQSAAGQFGVSMATVKTHLQHIFAKTDTSRQSELIRKIASMMPSVSLQ